ncbi:zeaxanthin epoxidase chloroplastic [Tripterygium wilfordii]|uniref:Zeaxanthin epoxidase, chloroplastic n=1 Tax=Tripterygium wilfordii TaxID=458696 RepID=A0A7J7CPZ6_TRIWF|nr:zeaxanthin epoxidase, chloroplastic isoform X1 [Tripterygium wilfordii]XP_038722277.1 zeaxanthin epoxidase, chloroplastic isoform X2 [Tripterygium wilfordii]KAF5736150.1 zeaxanthin epoxidase chloroplastic [Tripterygium wilfordii]
MASTLFCVSINPATALFGRTHYPKESQLGSSLSLHANFNHQFGSRRSGDQYDKKRRMIRAAVTEAPTISDSKGNQSNQPEKRKLRVLVAGGGIGGLVFALAAKKKGFEVVVFEKDLSAIRGEGQYRGPIQIQSNALAALEAIDTQVAEEVYEVGCITGDRVNGLVDGVSGTWYVKFDTFTPAAERGLPVTRVISRMSLQQILARAVGEDVILNGSNVVNFEDHGDKVTVVLEDGQQYEGDLLVGADGIWSKVRKNLFGPQEAIYSDYTCYTGICDFVPADIESVGYRVFLGHKQYFVSSDVGAGKMQWYAFHKEAPGGVDDPNGKKKRLLQIFEGWCDNVLDLLLATDEDAILRRDIYDRNPVLTWGRGRVTLLGDSIHAMQPNLGQGGCMAIEDGYQLALEIDKAWNQSIESGVPIDIVSSLRRYESARKLRVAIIHGMARMAAIMASTYKAYLGVGLGPLSFLTKFRIPHPGRVGGRLIVERVMPLTLSWVLGGNSSKLEGRASSCRLSDRANDELSRWLRDDEALERAVNGEWYLLPWGNETVVSGPICLIRDENKPCIIGSIPHESFPGSSLVLPSPQVSKTHARISYKDGAFFLIDLRSEHGTFITDNEGRRYRVPQNLPTRIRSSGMIEFGSDKQAVFRVKVMRTSPDSSPKRNEYEILQSV